jgi:oligopeptide/dipeptide ABC transporter ATP-binding protein
MNEEAFVSVRGLVKHFPIYRGVLRRRAGAVHAVNGVDFDIAQGTTLGLVGESGCGKSTAARLLVGLLRPSAGSVQVGEANLSRLRGEALRVARKDFQIIFQDPFGSLDPRMTVGDLIEEPLRVARRGTAAERRARVLELLGRVGLPPSHIERHPHEFSGGQRQRIGIARALALEPKLVVCDEPVSALDVSIQAQIVNLLKDLQRDLGLTYVFVSHDLAIVCQIANRVAVMYLGNIVEIADTLTLFGNARHPYTKALLAAVPEPDPALRRRGQPALSGELPSPINPPTGCAFHPRCALAQDICRTSRPVLKPHADRHAVACHLVDSMQVR